jgi:hypothetical protein
MRRAYEVLLRLYPRDFRAAFTSEMSTAFENSALEHRARGRTAYIRLALKELAGVLLGAPAEWMAKTTTDSSLRGRSLPDLLMMRPPGVAWEVHYRGDFVKEAKEAVRPRGIGDVP